MGEDTKGPLPSFAATFEPSGSSSGPLMPQPATKSAAATAASESRRRKKACIRVTAGLRSGANITKLVARRGQTRPAGYLLSRFSHLRAAARTFLGAVPPSLVRLATE